MYEYYSNCSKLCNKNRVKMFHFKCGSIKNCACINQCHGWQENLSSTGNKIYDPPLAYYVVFLLYIDMDRGLYLNVLGRNVLPLHHQMSNQVFCAKNPCPNVEDNVLRLVPPDPIHFLIKFYSFIILITNFLLIH